ncbi:NAD-dependent epimerase/dehydratase family protein [Gordonia sp. HY285]|uniref:NAD-dependent epimerase/dehydratase family protein n=1 Tax=Gordonia liuliyuniae TaxID=2911517 RepID=A0ABS9IPL8_9ACTN|nr:NAD-dependent epimerase/dehydratase family protein [Gordonia liuliyuniae]MCF8587505.1 NAD-dependent epimerase/dehydratase family protein [Gordonia liuliyuniae]MCF8608667.1 NAD-dependent epimerase/dehydratase family protein [Gordonia liuliyuniae]
MRIIVLGGDGFCGWPSSLRLALRGHAITIVDSLVRREIDRELGVDSLTPVNSLPERLVAWREVTGTSIGFEPLDVATDYERLVQVLGDIRPDAIVHFAEQRAAPYSMKSPTHRRYTVDNNVNATHNLLAAVTEVGVNAHVVHLGTMGVYGYDTVPMDLPEGYLTVSYPDRDGDTHVRDILYPTQPGSVYHLTKSLDQLLFQFYAVNDGLRITDLHQGIVWGSQTAETSLDSRLVNRFDYDGDYGTVLNRFLVEAAVGLPLTVHGSGGQTRAFININDSVQCIALAVESGDDVGDRVRVMNQMTETHRVSDLAAIVAELSGAVVSHVENPRREAEVNDLSARNDHLVNLGLDPIGLRSDLLVAEIELARVHAARVKPAHVPAESCWNRERVAARETTTQ